MDTNEPQPNATAHDRYRSFHVDDGTLVVYDGDNAAAWLQSDVTCDVEQ